MTNLCLHTTRTRMMEIEQGSPRTVTLWAERCHGCGVMMLYQRDRVVEKYPDGREVVVMYDPITGDLHGGSRADVDKVNALLNGSNH
jgi:hypothetical protein